MHPAAVSSVKPLRLIVEVDHTQLGAVVSQLVTLATAALPPHPHRSTPPPPAPAEDADDPEPPRAPGPDPPVVVASRQQAAGALAVPPGTVLGELCRRGHRHEGQRKSLRRVSNGKCLACLRQQERHRTPARLLPAPPVLVSQAGGRRPALPSHWEGRAFLSPILCSDPRHRFRDTNFTLRFTVDETCVQYCTDANPALALAGD